MLADLSMKDESKRKRAEIIKKLFDISNNNKRQDWEYHGRKSKDFYEDRQLTKEEIRDLKSDHMPTFTINRITPVVETMKYFVGSRTPSFQTVGADGSAFDSWISDVHNAIQKYCWEISDGDAVFGKVIHDSIVNQCGYWYLWVDKQSDSGSGDVMIDSISPYEVFVSPNTKSRLFKDATSIIIAKMVDRYSLISKLPEFEEQIKKASNNPIGPTSKAYFEDEQGESSVNPFTGDEDGAVSYFECYRKVSVQYISFMQTVPMSKEDFNSMQEESFVRLSEMKAEVEVSLKEELNKLNKMVADGEIIQERANLEYKKAERAASEQLKIASNSIIKEFSETLNRAIQRDVPIEAFKLLMDNPDVSSTIDINSVRDYYKTRIQIDIMVGDTILDTKLLECGEYPIIPVPFIHTGDAYPIGAVKFLIGKQQEMNKSHQIMVHHANLTTNPITLAPEGSITDRDDFEKRITIPGSVATYNSDEFGNKPEFRQNNQLNNAFFTITQEGREDFDYMSGISSRSMGIERSSSEPFRSTLLMDEFNTRRLQTFMMHSVEPSLNLMARVFQQLAQSLYKEYKVFRIASPAAGNEDAPDVMKKYEINKPVWDGYNPISKFHDYSSVRFDTKVVSGSAWPVSQEMIDRKYLEFFTAGLIDQVAALREVNIKDKAGIIERSGVVNRAKAEVEQLQLQVKSLNGDKETLMRQIMQLKIELGQIDAKTAIDKEVNDTKAEQKLLRGKEKLEVEKKLIEFEADLKEIKDALSKSEKKD